MFVSKALDAISKLEEETKEKEVEKISSQIAKELKINPDGEGDTILALKSAVKKLIDFTNKGGTIDFVIPENDDPEQSKANEELRLSFSEIRRIEAKINLLEHKDN